MSNALIFNCSTHHFVVLIIPDPITDPLSDPLSDPLLDPLSELSYLKVDVRSVKETNPAQNDQNPISEANNSWHKKKQQIMKDYSVDGSITFSSSTIEEVPYKNTFFHF